jgi:hypothetical protein
MIFSPCFPKLPPKARQICQAHAGFLELSHKQMKLTEAPLLGFPAVTFFCVHVGYFFNLSSFFAIFCCCFIRGKGEFGWSY